jgi:hypothetical protein
MVNGHSDSLGSQQNLQEIAARPVCGRVCERDGKEEKQRSV